MKKLGIGLGLALLVAGAARAEDLSGAAYSTCQMFALERLPKRAYVHFPGLGEGGTGSRTPDGAGPGHYQVLSFVDFRNSDGTLVRSSLYCELRSLGSDRWVLDRMAMDDGRVSASVIRSR